MGREHKSSFCGRHRRDTKSVEGQKNIDFHKRGCPVPPLAPFTFKFYRFIVVIYWGLKAISTSYAVLGLGNKKYCDFIWITYPYSHIIDYTREEKKPWIFTRKGKQIPLRTIYGLMGDLKNSKKLRDVYSSKNCAYKTSIGTERYTYFDKVDWWQTKQQKSYDDDVNYQPWFNSWFLCSKRKLQLQYI